MWYRFLTAFASDYRRRPPDTNLDYNFMGILFFQSDYARRLDGPHRQNGRRDAQATLCRIGAALFLGLNLAVFAPAFAFEPLRIAYFNTSLEREGPGLLLRDIGRDEEDVRTVAKIIAHVAPDVIVLEGIDYDHEQSSLHALQARIAQAGLMYPYLFSAPPNTGVPTGFDLNANGRLGEPTDAQGYGEFAGQGGLAILSIWPVQLVENHTELLWSDFNEGTPPRAFYGPEVWDILRLSSTAHWEVEVSPTDASPLRLMIWAGTAPVFDGPEDRNGRRNRDELWFWIERIAALPEDAPFVLMGNANLDPYDGDGEHAVIRALLSHPRLQDPAPQSNGARAAADPNHGGPAELDTVDWPTNRPGNLRTTYILPWHGARVLDAGVFWPAPGEEMAHLLGADEDAAGAHRLVWVDLAHSGPSR